MKSVDAAEPLPPLYARWIKEFLPGPVARESRATCDDCAMCARTPEKPGVGNYYFDPHAKCCTYAPTLHNFLVGRILSDEDPGAQVGRMRVEQAIRQGLAVTPLGLGKPAAYAVLYANSANAFGRGESLRCPYFIEDGGRCAVWRNRESTCATWFCKHDRGGVGRTFWRDALHRLLQAVEVDLAPWCVAEVGLGDEALRYLLDSEAWTNLHRPLNADAIDRRMEEEPYARIWGEWREREAEFFLRCAQLVNDLSWAEVLDICGPDARIYVRLTQSAHAELIGDELPPALKVGPFEVLEVRHEATRVVTYSHFDPIDVPNVVMAMLPWFDGRPIEDALSAIAEKSGMRLDRTLIRKLADFAVLIPAV